MDVNHRPAFPNTALLRHPIEEEENDEKMMIDKLDGNLQPLLTHSLLQNVRRGRERSDRPGGDDQDCPGQSLQQSTPRNIAVCLENTGN